METDVGLSLVFDLPKFQMKIVSYNDISGLKMKTAASASVSSSRSLAIN
jgi:hypothetical protein